MKPSSRVPVKTKNYPAEKEVMTHWKDLPQACWEFDFAHQTSGHGMFGGLSLLALLRRQLVVSPYAIAGSVYCSTQGSSDKSVNGSTTGCVCTD